TRALVHAGYERQRGPGSWSAPNPLGLNSWSGIAQGLRKFSLLDLSRYSFLRQPISVTPQIKAGPIPLLNNRQISGVGSAIGAIGSPAPEQWYRSKQCRGPGWKRPNRQADP